MSKYLHNLPIFHRSVFQTVQIAQRCAATTAAAEVESDVRPFSEIPGPLCFPIVGALPTIIWMQRGKGFADFNDTWHNILKKYGPISRYKFPGQPLLVAVTQPNDVEKMYRETMDNPVRDGFRSLKKIRYETPDDFFEKKAGLLIENGEEWWRIRSRAQTAMLRPKNLVRYIPQMDEVTLEFMDRISTFQKNFGEMPSNFQQELYKWALESVSLVALSRRLGCLNPDLSPDSPQMTLLKTVDSIFEHLNTTEMDIRWWLLFPTPAFKALRKGDEEFRRVADLHLRETEAKMMARKDDSDEKTLLEILLQKDGLSRKDVITIILDMLFAGIDTTSHTLGFCLYLLARNPNAQKRLQEEVDRVLGDGKEPMTESHLAQLSYLKSCIKESLRLFPLVIGNARVLQRDTVLCGYRVPKGCQILHMNTASSVDENLFSRANEFLPERWGRDQPLGSIHPFASLPFSHGPRMCIGRRIAEQEMYIFLARVMHRFNVDYKYKDMRTIMRLVFLPSEPLKFEFTERR